MERSSRILLLGLNGTPTAVLENLVHSITSGETQSAADGDADGTSKNEGNHDSEDEGSSSFVTSRILPEGGSSDAAATSAMPWTIDNRYYTAKVHFRCVSLALVGSRGQQRADLIARLAEELADITAVILVFSRACATSTQGVWSLRSRKVHEDLLTTLQQSASPSTSAQLSEEVTTLGLTPLGFDLAVSVAVALPAPKHEPQSMQLEIRQRADEASQEELLELYADQGWEYVNLGIDFEDTDSESGKEEEEDDDEEEEDEEEKEKGGPARNSHRGSGAGAEAQGLERVREALEANMWPNLERKTDGARRKRNDAAAERSQTVRTGSDEDSGDEDAQLEAMLRKLDLDLPTPSASLQKDSKDATEASSRPLEGLQSLDRDPTLMHGRAADSSINAILGDAEPTKEDEELARKFLAQIVELERSTEGRATASGSEEAGDAAATAVESEEQRKRNQADALRRLEEFLASEDPEWNAGSRALNDESRVSDALQSDEEATLRQGSRPIFEDDFDAFVSAEEITAVGHSSSSAKENSQTGPWPDAPHHRWNIGDGINEEHLADEDVGFDFGSSISLAELRSEAQRVRGMPGNVQDREREAERVVQQMLRKWDLE